ncbi:MAG: hypothetical protein KQI35_13100 [Bacteroidetes bacterium]|nr:hypothetical protein [Bacteroidota bacterium]
MQTLLKYHSGFSNSRTMNSIIVAAISLKADCWLVSIWVSVAYRKPLTT